MTQDLGSDIPTRAGWAEEAVTAHAGAEHLTREEQVLERIVKASVLEVFRARTRPERLARLVAAFDEGVTVNTGEDVAASEYAGLLPKLDGLRDALADLGVGETPAGVASAVEFVLEGLHLSKRLNKDAVGGKATYRGRG